VHCSEAQQGPDPLPRAALLSLTEAAKAKIWDLLCPSAWDSQDGCRQAGRPGAAVPLRDLLETATHTLQSALPRAQHDAAEHSRAGCGERM